MLKRRVSPPATSTLPGPTFVELPLASSSSSATSAARPRRPTGSAAVICGQVHRARAAYLKDGRATSCGCGSTDRRRAAALQFRASDRLERRAHRPTTRVPQEDPAWEPSMRGAFREAERLRLEELCAEVDRRAAAGERERSGESMDSVEEDCGRDPVRYGGAA